MEYKDTFGFLPIEIAVSFNGGEIRTLDSIDKTISDLSKHFDNDGSFCPPEDVRDLYRLTPTHEIILNNLNDYDDQRHIRLNDSGYIIQLLAYIYGVRTQFHDWWYDSKIPCKSKHNICVTPTRLSEFMSYSYDQWKKWQDDERKLFTNILYMNSRFESYCWDWEKLMISYMVLDGCYKFAEQVYGINGGSHAGRINRLCEFFGLKQETHNIERIVELRNQLFHESLWSNAQPCTAPPGDAFSQVYNLNRFNQRLIVALLRFKTDYIHSSWTSFGTWGF